MPTLLARQTSLIVLSAAMVMLFALAIFAIVPARATNNVAPTTGDFIVETALTYVDTYQGECWPWVRRVVQEATGNVMGFGYRDGFFEGGAIEVSLAEAAPGDVIQIADDTNAGPGADYLGLHTAIVYLNHGDGSFTVIDSNSQWDGMVRIRENYDPVWAANRYVGLNVRVYRFGEHGTGNGSPAGRDAGVDIPAFEPGDTVRVATGGDCLNLREAPGIGNRIMRCLLDRTALSVVSGPEDAGGLVWVMVVTDDGETGWVAARYLSLVEAAADAGAGDSAPATGAGEVEPSMPYRSFAPGLISNP
jgi:hypothetical protein